MCYKVTKSKLHIPKEKVGEVLPWVHIAISNAKRQILNTFHDAKPEFLQRYLDEFCYKFNRRFLGEALFNRLLVACVSYKNEFRYIYGYSFILSIFLAREGRTRRFGRINFVVTGI